MAIGIFDSGVGGLTVLRELKKKYPNQKVIYFADLANFPYGIKSNEEVISYAKNITEFLISEDVSSIIVACNTASSISLDILKKEYNIKFYGMISAVTKYILSNNITNLTLLATNATIKSKAYKNILGERLVNEIAAPKLVECAESLGKINVKKELLEYLNIDMLKNTNIILGCTHFPLLEESIRDIYNQCKLIDPAIELIKTINLDCDSGSDIYYTSANLEYFKLQLKNILGKEDLDVRLHKW